MSKFKVGDKVLHRIKGTGIVVGVKEGLGILIRLPLGVAYPSNYYGRFVQNLPEDSSYWMADVSMLELIKSAPTFKGNV